MSLKSCFPLPTDLDTVVCPEPLIKNNNRTANRTSCPGTVCCVPCPYANYVLKESQLVANSDAQLSFAVIFSLFTVATVISYAINPSKRRFPQNLILAMSFSVILLFVPSWITLIVGEAKVPCNNEFDAVRVHLNKTKQNTNTNTNTIHSVPLYCHRPPQESRTPPV